MTGIKRRDFLQLLGIGAAVTIVPVPLFASDDTSIWTPDQNLLSGHIVLTRPAVMTSPGGVTRAGVRTVSGGYKWPKLKGQVYKVTDKKEGAGIQDVTGVYVRHGSTMSGNRFSNLYEQTEVDLVMVDNFGEEPHVDILHTAKTESTLGFYKASMQLRDSFKDDSVAMLNRTAEYNRQGLQIVTLVNTPIFVGPLDQAGWREYNYNEYGEPDSGFRVSMDYVQYLVRGTLDYNGWVEYSTTGGYPIEQPGKLDWDYIYKLEKQYVAGEFLHNHSRNRTSRLILP